MELDLSEIRKNIDRIDEQLLNLFLERMECSRQVAEYKIKNNMPILNTKREQEILDNIANKSGDLAKSTTLLFSTIMNVSRAAQYPIVTENSDFRKKLENAIGKEFSPKKIGFQGTIGSYSYIAAKELYKDCELVAFKHFEDVFKAIISGEIDTGVLPCENSFAGPIDENYDLLLKYDLKINAMLDLPVNHCLLAKNGTNINDIKTVYSHEQALNQCEDFIKSHCFETVAMENTAFAAEFVAQSEDKSIAAIASMQTAEDLGLIPLFSSIQSSDKNFTRFMSVSKEMCVPDNADIISIAFSIEHTAGSLYKTLSMLAASGLNMTRIESRPDKESPFRYVFYVDFIGNINDNKALSLLCGLNDELLMLKVFGNCKINKI